ncbi:hypothetical protein [Bosea sp. (in: a-proteobacteria)]|uniref:hypothetical protein n=1 Tax=Bosea sp. (in: a-proteobacteria) TaxID=1871050 RepID=UPI002B499E5E|nr:hypothetical protein [Bosea sp. (in: a-proteobacteria)]WRH56701.1 MAG: hypothetical protein RSE11_16865 [Bosea sp. (in: a-proteobacteria)]
MSTAPLEAWWNLRQALIWIATRDLGWVAEAKPEYGFGGREAQGDSFDAIWAHARTSDETLPAYTKPDAAKFELLAKVAEGELKAAQDGKVIPIVEFMGATVSDENFLGTHVRRIETVQLGQYSRGDALIYKPRFIADQVMRLFPAVGSVAAPISAAEKHMTDELATQATTERHRDYDTAPERGDAAIQGPLDCSLSPSLQVPDGPATAGDNGTQTAEGRGGASRKGSEAEARRAWEQELAAVRAKTRSQRSQREIERDYVARFLVSRPTVRSWIVGTRRRGRPSSG